MTVLIATRGLPASGKTTKAKAWVEGDAVNRARVCRDDLRGMCHNGKFIAKDDVLGTERAIVAVRDAAVRALLERGISVVVDETNLPSRSIRQLRRLATLAKAGFEVWDLTNVPYEECLRRNAIRRPGVPDEVITKMWRDHIQGRSYPLPIADDPADNIDAEQYVPVEGASWTVLVDVDGTVALMGNRDPFDETRVHEDLPNWPVIHAVRAMAYTGYTIVFMSGRSENCRAATEKWLEEHIRDVWDVLLMRPAGDTRADAVVKLELFNREIRHRYNVIGVYDDRQQVVDMWRSLGLTVFQVAEGKF